MYDSPHTGARVGKHKIWSSNYVVRRLRLTQLSAVRQCEYGRATVVTRSGA